MSDTPAPRDIAIVIPAAGASSRMRGRDKLLEEVAGRPLLRLVAERACSVSGRVVVTLPAPPGPRGAVLEGLALCRMPVPEAAEGMGASLRAGIGALPEGLAGVMILPADMPEITGADLARLMRAFRADPGLWQATSEDGRPGHPVVFPADCLPALAGLSGDAGARAVLRAHRLRLRYLALPGSRALVDLDTPEAWAAWRAGRQDPPTSDAT